MSVPRLLAAEIVDLGPLLRAVVASLAFGVGLTAAFSFAVLGAVRFQEHRRAGNPTKAALYAAVGAVALAVFGAGLVLGLAIMLDRRHEAL